MKDNMDILLEKALQPNEVPRVELNASILEKAKRRRKKNMWYGVPKVAVAALVFALLCPIGVYATNLILKQVLVTEHTMTVGDTEYFNEKDIVDSMNSTEEVKTDIVSHEEGNANVKWLTKDVQKLNGLVTNTYYTYDDYKAMLEDTKMPNWFSKDYELSENASYVNTKDDTIEEDAISATFKYGEGEGRIHLSVTKRIKGFAENVSSSLYLTNTGNKRTYKNVDGVEFTLVDEVRESGETKVTRTYVVIAYDMYDGHIFFENLTEEQMHEVLDTIKISQQ